MNRLHFEGKGLAFFKLALVDFLLTLVSLTLLYPRALVREANYLWSQTTLGGDPFQFKGTFKEAFNGYMKVLLAFIILIAILFVETLALLKTPETMIFLVPTIEYATALLFCFFLMPMIIHGDLKFFTSRSAWRTVTPTYRGKLSELTGLAFRGSLLTLFTVGFYTAWYETQMNRYILRNLRFGSLRFEYKGQSRELFRIYLKGFLLGLVTFGIYNIWTFKEWYAYTVRHIMVRKGEQEFNLHSDADTRDAFELLVGNFLLVVLTLGIGTPWAYMRSCRFIVNHCIVPAEFNLDAIEDMEAEEETLAASSHWLDKWNPMLIG